MDKRYREMIEWVDSGPFDKAEVLIALKLEEAERMAPVSRGKLKVEDYGSIIYELLTGTPAKALAAKFGVSEARISEIKREKSIPAAALTGYLEAKGKALRETE